MEIILKKRRKFEETFKSKRD